MGLILFTLLRLLLFTVYSTFSSVSFTIFMRQKLKQGCQVTVIFVFISKTSNKLKLVYFVGYMPPLDHFQAL